jgi:hypothetical protein
VRLADPDSRGSAFEELMVLYITKQFRHPAPIEEIFEFHGTRPAWASHAARLVRRIGKNDFEPVDLDTQRPVTPCTGVAYYASNVAGVIQWLTESTVGWCLPGDLFGPDLLAWMSLSSGEVVLLMVQDKSYLSSNKDSVAAKTTTAAVRSLTPGHWFKKAVRSSPFTSCLMLIHMQLQSPAERHRLNAIINKYKLLLVVASYPLRVNMDAKSDNLAAALADIGDTPLATLHPDPFLASLKSDNEHDDLLVGMESALKRKRDPRLNDSLKKPKKSNT